MSTAEDLIHILHQAAGHENGDADGSSLLNYYKRVRQQSLLLCNNLETEDFELQADVFVSPIKWHLAHTSWFFETFILKNIPAYQIFHPQFEYLFNSYYNAVGKQYPRDKRGLMSRPTVQEVKAYRRHVDHQLLTLLSEQESSLSEQQQELLVLGLNHEQQHQELMLTDLKYCLSFNPLYPIYSQAKFPAGQSPDQDENYHLPAMEFIEFGGGVYNFGLKEKNNEFHFGFDNETPRHNNMVHDFRLANRLVTNREYVEFIEAGGYQDPQFWLADGWAWVQENNISTPLYWHLEGPKEKGQERYEFRLTGYGKLHPNQPVTHVSFYEADAYARWAGKRLPSEYEWEVASKKREIKGTFVESQSYHPLQVSSTHDECAEEKDDCLRQMFGDCWQWTQSSYAPYPGFKAPAGAVGEYNGKFMCNQMVLRGGSCATPKDHIRSTYRNFFYPQDRWQFTGIRLAEDV